MIDEPRFRLLYDTTARPLRAYLIRVTGDRHQADDVFQESYLRVLQSGQEDLDDAKLKSYLFTVATNIVRDHWRRRRMKARWEEEPAEGSEGPGHHDGMDVRLEIEKSLGVLSPQQRSLVWLAYVEGYRHREIAAMLGLGEKSVRVLLFRARKKLASILTLMGVKAEYNEK